LTSSSSSLIQIISALVALKVQSFLEDKQIYKVIVVPEHRVNIVCGQ